MTQASAPMSTAIKVITGLVLVMTVAILIAAIKVYCLLWGGAVLATVVFFCYLYAPIAYELTGDQLTVQFRLGQKVFQAVTGCSTLSARPPMGLRLWGNGGFQHLGFGCRYRAAVCLDDLRRLRCREAGPARDLTGHVPGLVKLHDPRNLLPIRHRLPPGKVAGRTFQRPLRLCHGFSTVLILDFIRLKRGVWSFT